MTTNERYSQSTHEHRVAFAHHAIRVCAFMVLALAIFVSALWTSSKIHYADHTLLQYLTRNPLQPGGQYQSLKRFRDAERAGQVDVVFFGSSHGYRGFDPRIFLAAGFSAYNLSSTNQTPLNTYYLAERYLPALAPKLVVFEIYYHTLSTDGLEACRDLAVNTPSSWPMIRMAFATQNLGAVSFAIAKRLGLATDESKAEQRPIDGETYIAGGFCETHVRRSQLSPGQPIAIEIQSRQVEYLKDASALAQSLGARVVWVTHPFPKDHRARIAEYDGIRDTISRAANDSGVPYWDFNDQLALDPLADFQDFHHLNASGVEKFNRALLVRLASSGDLAPRSSHGR